MAFSPKEEFVKFGLGIVATGIGIFLGLFTNKCTDDNNKATSFEAMKKINHHRGSKQYEFITKHILANV